MTCDETPEDMGSNWGQHEQQKLLELAPELVRIDDWANKHDFFEWTFRLLYVQDIDIGWLRKHLGHDVHVCCESGCPCPHVRASQQEAEPT